MEIYNNILTLVNRYAASSITISTLSFLVVFLYFYFNNKYSYWQRKSLKNPKPLWFIGNFFQLILFDLRKQELEWVKKFGNLYGIYAGTTPKLIVADPEIINEISIKAFDSFQNHEVNDFGNEITKSALFLLQSDHWKRVRALMSPTFTSGKIKRMFSLLNDCAEDLLLSFCEKLPSKEATGQQNAIINLKEQFSLFSMDGISTCCYGIKLKRAASNGSKTNATRDDFVEEARQLFNVSIIRLLIIMITPKPIKDFFGFELAKRSQLAPLQRRVKSLLSWRRKSKQKVDDYLQLLIDAKLEHKLELDELDLKENHHAGLTTDSLIEDQKKLLEDLAKKDQSISSITLSDKEIEANAMIFLAVGLETTGALLTNCTYALAFHQDIQQRLYEELQKICEFNGDKNKYEFTYEALTCCTYLDAVISETLRAMPPFFAIDRVANKDYRIEKCKLDVPKGSRIQLASYAVMNDPRYWKEPSKFDPDRFMPGNKEKIVPGSYCPFGLGPRHCIGMRFSLTEAKLALAKLMMGIKFEPAPGLNYPPEPKRFVLGLNAIRRPEVRIVAR